MDCIVSHVEGESSAVGVRSRRRGTDELSQSACWPTQGENPSYSLTLGSARGLGALEENVVRIGTCAHLLGPLDPKSILGDSAKCMVDDRLAAVKLPLELAQTSTNHVPAAST